MARSVEIVFGPPGTGKTEYLLSIVQKALENDVAPERIGFVSFSRRAVKEMATRAAERFGSVEAEHLTHFRTIHSTAYHMLGLTRDDVLQEDHLSELGKLIGERFSSSQDDPQLWWEGSAADKALALHNVARARSTSLEAEWRTASLPDLPWFRVRNLVQHYEDYKARHALRDFHDMVTQAEGQLDVDLLLVDEAQDTSRAQWKFLQRVTPPDTKVHLAGDDDQAVYGWSGADETFLLEVRGDRKVLPNSHRLPVQVKYVADRVASRITRRVAKQFTSRPDEGEVTWINDLGHVDLRQNGTWLLLARSNYQLRALRGLARRQGVVYSLPDGKWSWSLPAVRSALAYERLRRGHSVTRIEARAISEMLLGAPELPRADHVTWDWLGERSRELTWMDALTLMPDRDREYVRALRRGGESLTGPGRVRIGTVHSVKGAEADNVLLLTDVSERVAEGARVNPDAELRVQYVGVTRAKNRLVLVQPTTRNFWSI